MEYFLEFHWWYVLVVIVLLFVFFGKGGVVKYSFVAELEPIDEIVKDCRGYAARKFFRNGKDEKFVVDIQDISLLAGELVELYLNAALFKTLTVKRSREIEFDIWNTDEQYPKVQLGDEVEIRYLNKPIFSGTFRDKD